MTFINISLTQKLPWGLYMSKCGPGYQTQILYAALVVIYT